MMRAGKVRLSHNLKHPPHRRRLFHPGGTAPPPKGERDASHDPPLALSQDTARSRRELKRDPALR